MINSTKRKQILLTGATGFLGQQLVQHLIQDNRIALRLALRTANKQFSDDRIARFSLMELSETTDWSKALKGCDVVIHTAARAHVIYEKSRNPLQEFRKVNTEGTLHLARQAAYSGVKRFIFLSSIGVNGNVTSGQQIFSPDDLPNPSTPYAISKHEAEQGLQALSSETGMEVVIIRPPLVYGRGAKGNFYRMVRWLQKGLFLPLAAIKNKRGFVSISNLVSLITVCIDHPRAANQIFLVSDGEDLSTPALLQKIADIMNIPVRLFPMPQFILHLAALLFGKKADFQRLCGSLRIDISKTCQMLDWKPISMDEEISSNFVKD